MAATKYLNGGEKRVPEKTVAQPLKVAIVGAGIGGLSAAIALRRAGHCVALYEQSRLAGEVGAAVHLAPNANGLLRRFGLYAADFGATPMDRMKGMHSSGHVAHDVDFAVGNTMWQHPWETVHRASLHNALKTTATEDTGSGRGQPAQLYTSSKVVDIDPVGGVITLADGSIVQADVLIGADGVYSCCRDAVLPNSPKPFSSGKAAFRLLVPTQRVREDPETAHVAEKNTMYVWRGEDRRVVMYPCNHNETLNLVCIHPDSESHATPGDEWNKTTSMEQILHVFRGFDTALLRLIQKADPSELQVWQLLDMAPMSSWTNGKLALLGDAAHPFTPYQGQGAAQAIEDAVALAAVLPLGTTPEDVPERLKLYKEIRADRAHTIQEYSRQAGEDRMSEKPKLDPMTYTNYNFSHDAYDHATNIFRRWLWARTENKAWRMPMPLWPESSAEHGRDSQAVKLTTAEIRFKTSKTFLETLFPVAAFKFKAAPSVCQASFSVTTANNLPWLGGRSYSRFGLYIHGVQYVGEDGRETSGAYLPVLLDDLADTFIPGRQDVGVPRAFCEFDIAVGEQSFQLRGSRSGRSFLEMNLGCLGEDTSSEMKTGISCWESTLAYRHIPAVGKPGADAEYPILVPAQDIRIGRVLQAKDASIRFDAGDARTLPTLHHIAAIMAQIPIFTIESARVVEGHGDPMVTSSVRVV